MFVCACVYFLFLLLSASWSIILSFHLCLSHIAMGILGGEEVLSRSYVIKCVILIELSSKGDLLDISKSLRDFVEIPTLLFKIRSVIL